MEQDKIFPEENIPRKLHFSHSNCDWSTHTRAFTMSSENLLDMISLACFRHGFTRRRNVLSNKTKSLYTSRIAEGIPKGSSENVYLCGNYKMTFLENLWGSHGGGTPSPLPEGEIYLFNIFENKCRRRTRICNLLSIVRNTVDLRLFTFIVTFFE